MWELVELARNPGLPAALVTRLVNVADEVALRRLAWRDDLSPEQVTSLARRGGHDVVLTLIRSGAMPISQIPAEDPWALLAGLNRPDVPAAWLPALASWPDVEVRRQLAQEGRHRADVARALADDPDSEVAGWVALCDELPAELAHRLVQRPDPRVLASLATNTTTPLEILAALLVCDQPLMLDSQTRHSIQIAALRNPSTPPAAIPATLDKVDGFGDHTLATRPDLPEAIYRRFAADQNPDFRMSVAANPALPTDLLATLLTDPVHKVRRAAATNSRIPPHLLARAARAGVKVHTPHALAPSTLHTWSADPDPRVRMLAADSPSLTPDLMAVLITDPDARVATRAARHHWVTAPHLRALADQHGPATYRVLSRHENCPPDVLHAIAAHPSSPPRALRDVARHERTPLVALLSCLHRDVPVAFAAQNSNLPPAILSDLLSHPDPDVRCAAAANPSLPAAAMTQLIKQAEQQ